MISALLFLIIATMITGSVRSLLSGRPLLHHVLRNSRKAPPTTLSALARSSMSTTPSSVSGEEDCTLRGNSSQREVAVEALRKRMVAAGVDALVVPSDDPHLSEYVASCFERRSFVSGFTGSAGTAVVFAVDLDQEHHESGGSTFPTKGLLWTDGRYHIQAEKELGDGWGLMRAGLAGVPSVGEFLASTVGPGGKVGVDPSCHSASSCEALRNTLASNGVALTFTTTTTTTATATNDAAAAATASAETVVTTPAATTATVEEKGGNVVGSNWVDEVWSQSRPPMPTSRLRVHPLAYAGQTPKQKLKELRKAVNRAGADATVVGALDEVAWLLNLRGDDVECNPVFLSYVLVGPSIDKENDDDEEEGGGGETTLFVDLAKLTPEVSAHLTANGVKVAPYGSVAKELKQGSQGHGWRVLGDPNRLNAELWATVPPSLRIPVPNLPGTTSTSTATTSSSSSFHTNGNSPLAEAKSVKNSHELKGMQEAHVRDGAAMARFFAWLFDTVHHNSSSGGDESSSSSSSSSIDEVDMDLMATKFRKATSPHHFVGLSFPTIAGADEHGAIVHYRASRSDPTFKVGTIGKDTMLLLDSGAQYLDGTTDVTRTVHLGTPTAFQKEAFTRVLQGHIAMDEAVFPEGTPGFVLDVLARKSLWSAQMDYAHGTGHGVGAALNVHEGPQGVSPRYANYNPLKSGMVISNEPGFYYSPATTTPSTMSTTATTSNADDDKDKRVGKGFGIRIETLLQIVPVDKALAATPAAPQTTTTTTTTGFLKFERLTMIPIQKRLIDFALLSPHEVEWLNAYHAQVREKVAPLLEEEAGGHPRALEWLYEWTAPVGEVTK